MKTVKTQIFDNVLKVLTKEINGQTAVSCDCCCWCNNYDLDDLLYGPAKFMLGEAGFPYVAEECGDFSAFQALKPSGISVQMQTACLRWLCRQVILTENGPETISKQYGGPTTNDKDLNDIILECLGERSGAEFAGLANGSEVFGVQPEEYGLCYLYAFEFFGWRKKYRTVAPIQDGEWVSSDIIVSLYRRDTPL